MAKAKADGESLSAKFKRYFRANPDLLRVKDSEGIRAAYEKEHGDTARAEFIRVQIELARTPPDAPGRHQLQRRVRELLRDHAAEWEPFALPPRRADWTWMQNGGAAVSHAPHFPINNLPSLGVAPAERVPAAACLAVE